MDFQLSCNSMDERSIGIYSQISQNCITDRSLQTFLCEVESVLNGCPLTSVRDDIPDFKPLTPNHLLLGEASPN